MCGLAPHNLTLEDVKYASWAFLWHLKNSFGDARQFSESLVCLPILFWGNRWSRNNRPTNFNKIRAAIWPRHGLMSGLAPHYLTLEDVKYVSWASLWHLRNSFGDASAKSMVAWWQSGGNIVRFHTHLRGRWRGRQRASDVVWQAPDRSANLRYWRLSLLMPQRRKPEI